MFERSQRPELPKARPIDTQWGLQLTALRKCIVAGDQIRRRSASPVLRIEAYCNAPPESGCAGLSPPVRHIRSVTDGAIERRLFRVIPPGTPHGWPEASRYMRNSVDDASYHILLSVQAFVRHAYTSGMISRRTLVRR